jgi:hypothetical protein
MESTIVLEQEVKQLKKDLAALRKNMVSKDEIMTAVEYDAYRKSFTKQNLYSLEDVKNKLGF